MSRQITKKQKDFADEYLKTGNGTKSALSTYETDSENMAAVIASTNIRKDKIQRYIEDKAEHSAENIVELGNQRDNLPVALGANKDILDRAGFKPIDKSETKSVNLNFDVKIDSKKAKIKSKFEKELYESL